MPINEIMCLGVERHTFVSCDVNGTSEMCGASYTYTVRIRTHVGGKKKKKRRSWSTTNTSENRLCFFSGREEVRTVKGKT